MAAAFARCLAGRRVRARVQRLGPPHWPAYPTGAAYGRIYDRDAAAGLRAAYLGARLIAADLMAVGIDVDCLPIADVPVADADPVIGDRAYGITAEKVAAIARAVSEWSSVKCRGRSPTAGAGRSAARAITRR